jgi:hypothetical protein
MRILSTPVRHALASLVAMHCYVVFATPVALLTRPVWWLAPPRAGKRGKKRGKEKSDGERKYRGGPETLSLFDVASFLRFDRRISIKQSRPAP